MISVCMGVKNGARFLRPQLDSILHQLSPDDEVIISDDHSTDESVSIIQSYCDPRICFFQNPGNGIADNFEFALLQARGSIIFLADQDDIWLPDKIKRTLPHLIDHDLVVSDCTVVNQALHLLNSSFYEFRGSGRGVMKNILKNSYIGCCMAFKRALLQKALPIPHGVMHDHWLGLIGESFFNVSFISDKLVMHRRHGKNASTTCEESKFRFMQKFSYRVNLALNLIESRYAQ